MEELKMFDVVYADMSVDRVGSEQRGVRPAIIVQNNVGNKHSSTVLIMSLTTSIKKNYLPTHCIIKKSEENGLTRNSMLLGETLTQISKDRIETKIGSITDSEVQNQILNVYIANITGRKVYNPIWTTLLNKIFRLVKGEETNEDGNAA